jgi:hypothetical protein
MPSRHKLKRKKARAIAWGKEVIAKRKRRKAKAVRLAKDEDSAK